MDQEGDLVENFMCQMIPEASKTCKRLKQNNLDLTRANSSVKVEHDIISVLAHEKGLVNSTLSRPTVVENVDQHIKESGIVLPRRCDDDQLRDQIHDWLLDSEKLMFPESWSPDISDALESLYSSYYATGKLCDLDTEKILGDQQWIRYFSTIGTSS
mmetsp:Transcript_81098/g.164258  ORF Transcript_81098/g.164258 Transcript_81098/m.164258 type:complete len:157 (+) Transcript_81098:3-473(+)